MALHDIDKTTTARTKSLPNASDGVINRMAHQTVSTQYKPVGDGDTARIQQVGKTIIINNGSDNCALAGYNQALNDWGFYSTKDGFDVLTNTDLNNFSFNSNQNMFKIKESYLATINQTYHNVTTGYSSSYQLAYQIDHNLSFTPQAEGYIDLGGVGNYIQLPAMAMGIVPSGALAGSPYWIRTYIATTDVHINVITNFMIYNATGATGQQIATSADNIKIYIKQETAN